MRKTYIHVTDAPIILRDGDSLIDQHVIGGGSRYGRILFDLVLVEVAGEGVTITDNHFEVI